MEDLGRILPSRGDSNQGGEVTNKVAIRHQDRAVGKISWKLKRRMVEFKNRRMLALKIRIASKENRGSRRSIHPLAAHQGEWGDQALHLKGEDLSREDLCLRIHNEVARSYKEVALSSKIRGETVLVQVQDPDQIKHWPSQRLQISRRRSSSVANKNLPRRISSTFHPTEGSKWEILMTKHAQTRISKSCSRV